MILCAVTPKRTWHSYSCCKLIFYTTYKLIFWRHWSFSLSRFVIHYMLPFSFKIDLQCHVSKYQYFCYFSSDLSMNQDKDFKSRSKKRKKGRRWKPLFKGMLGWVFWLASPFTRAWHRHRVVLACTPERG